VSAAIDIATLGEAHDASPPATGQLRITQMTAAERPFVLDSWVRSYLPFRPPYAPSYGMGAKAWTLRCAERLTMAQPVLVATLDQAPDVVLGWACGGPGVLHYCYVRQPARRNGIASALLQTLLDPPRTGLRLTHRPGKHLRVRARDFGRYEPLTMEEIS